MARQIQTRWKVSATLKALTPLHVGGMGGDADSDLALAINGRGNYYIPGTSLAGALRGWMGQAQSETLIKDFWGDHESEQRGASFILVEDAEVKLTHGQRVEIREGVGIDRHTGAAAERFKYSRAILPTGVFFELNLTLDCQKHDPAELWRLLQAMEQGHIRIGAAKTRGLGRVKLDTIAIHRQNLSTTAGIFTTLLDGGESQTWEALKASAVYTPPPRLTLDIAWKPRDPVMVKAEGDGIAVDMLPLVSQVEAGVRFVIPGSSLKGVLRAHAERIVRTVYGQATTDDFLKQVDLTLINQVFGSAAKGRNALGQMGALAIDDCYATVPMSADDWSTVENAPEMTSELKSALGTALGDDDTPFRKLQPAMHVAVDRWTGGAAEGMLYSVLEPIGIEWDSIGLHLDIHRLQQYDDSALVKPAIALLLLVLRDFAHRKIPIGYGTNRGMGTVEVTAMTLTGSNLEGLEALAGEHPLAADLSSLDQPLLVTLTEAWQSWIAGTVERASQEAA
jgi:CRISPR/Cas system CSM-associated protein Csm3 (group 7 of RAMP superfamily)